MKTITIPEAEYLEMRKKITLLGNTDFLKKVNALITMLYQEKYDLFLSDFTGDLEEYSLDNITEWDKESGWDDV